MFKVRFRYLQEAAELLFRQEQRRGAPMLAWVGGALPLHLVRDRIRVRTRARARVRTRVRGWGWGWGWRVGVGWLGL